MIAPVPVHCFSITFKNLLSRNQWAVFDETWYEASDTQAHYFVDFDLLYGMVKFYNFGFYIGKSDNDGFFGIYCILCAEIWFTYVVN